MIQLRNTSSMMECKWADGVCVDNDVVAGLPADDFQDTSTKGARFTKADELKDEKGARTAYACGLDEAKARFFGDSLAVVYGGEHAVGKDKSQPNIKVADSYFASTAPSDKTLPRYNVNTFLNSATTGTFPLESASP
jgi:hypothetical protein